MKSTVGFSCGIFAIQNLSQLALQVINEYLHQPADPGYDWERFLFVRMGETHPPSDGMVPTASDLAVRGAIHELYGLDGDWYNIPDLMRKLRKLSNGKRPSYVGLRTDSKVTVVAVRNDGPVCHSTAPLHGVTQ